MEERYYQKEIETMPVEEIKKLQSEKLVKQVQHVWDNCPPYRKLMEEKGVTPADIKGIDDLHRLCKHFFPRFARHVQLDLVGQKRAAADDGVGSLHIVRREQAALVVAAIFHLRKDLLPIGGKQPEDDEPAALEQQRELPRTTVVKIQRDDICSSAAMEKVQQSVSS